MRSAAVMSTVDICVVEHDPFLVPPDACRTIATRGQIVLVQEVINTLVLQGVVGDLREIPLIWCLGRIVLFL